MSDSQYSMQYFDLLAALAEPGCPMCRLVSRDVARYIDSVMYEYVNDIDTNNGFRAARGLCSTHSWQMQDTRGGTLGISILFEAALDQLRRDEQGAGGGGFGRLLGRDAGGGTAAALQPRGPCLACKTLERAEAHYAEVMAARIDEPEMQTAFEASEGGICVPHVRRVMRTMTSGERARQFMTLQRAKWAQLQEELNLFITKLDRQRESGAVIGHEADSWRRAIAYLTGAPEVFGLRRE